MYRFLLELVGWLWFSINYLGSQVTGTQLASMLETYVDAINDPSTIPVMETSWETSLRLLIERFFNEALELYKEGMDQTLADCGEEPLETNGTVGKHSNEKKIQLFCSLIR